MSSPCHYPLLLKGVARTPNDLMPLSDIFTGITYFIKSDFTCPYTGDELKSGDLVFWDSVYHQGIWRVMRTNTAEIPE